MKKRNKAVIKGIGKNCPKCSKPMQRRKHPDNWVPTKSYYFTEWDMCIPCKHIQHYDEFRSGAWQEAERQNEHMRNI